MPCYHASRKVTINDEDVKQESPAKTKEVEPIGKEKGACSNLLFL